VLGRKRVAPVIPASLVVVLLGIGVVELLDLDVDIVGPIEGGLPSFGLPEDVDYGALAAGGVAVMLVGSRRGWS
jgi:sulfate permease, SulP family